ncbi:thioesterase family protein [Lentilitoribacter sp. Alg239-R112]|jgi:fluoroacetyl-CoA thioesterase|uniref:thioesterase family protein n=1 Tax=Lentilitoribacter sp. Alg239-R112 TaxID=2305987 RepID=UPI0013A69E79|nr:thioesterase family protein [Lentilitoribacter sp. Alg239-R112]
MKDTMIAGLTHETRVTVTKGLTVPEVSEHFKSFHTMPEVFATAYMVGFMELCCIELMAAHLDNGEDSVGIDINVDHSAPTPTGMEVTAHAKLIDVSKRVLTFEVTASDNAGTIGKGLHKRAVINAEKFNQMVADKSRKYA